MRSRLLDHLFENQFDEAFIPTEFSLYVKNQVTNILKHWNDNDQAINRKTFEAITIDWEESKDLDDAVWVEKTKNWYCIWTHISDVAETIPLFSPLDIEALKRWISIYRADGILPMIPEELSNSFLSLNEGPLKRVLTTQIDLDNNANVKNVEFFEAFLKNLKRYDHESFWKDLNNPDSTNYQTLHLMKEISDKLKSTRKGVSWFKEEDRRLYIWYKEKTIKSTSGVNSHDIIESLMVFTNNIVGNFLKNKWENPIFKKQLWRDEESFYTVQPWKHIGLWTQNYTHFTSPIRRYVDLVTHRIIKSLIRWEKNPYIITDLQFIAQHMNNTILKVQNVWSQIWNIWLVIDSEIQWRNYLKKLEKRLWKTPEVFDMKLLIRKSINRSKKIPNCVKEVIKTKIETSPISSWAWFIWVALFSKENDLKELITKRLLDNNVTTLPKVLTLISQTQIIKWWETIFRIEEVQEHNKFEVKIFLHWKNIIQNSMDIEENNTERVKWVVRRKVINKIFNYFISL